MVLLTNILRCVKVKTKVFAKSRKGFLDSITLVAKGGSGGSGQPKYGGVGGKGGCVYCIGSKVESLREVNMKYPHKTVFAKHGQDSTNKKFAGDPGEDASIDVPVGISVLDDEGRKLGEVNYIGDTCVLARGGPGGDSTNNFIGFEGQEHKITLDLRLIADVGLIGFPNAGKSTFLKAVSKAKPKIANYPFTTIKPNVGIIEYRDRRQISVADLPGLIEGAHVNIGMGHKFLKHVERTKLLLLIADISGFALTPKHGLRSCLETIILLNKELEMYNPELLHKPAILAINKVDLHESNVLYQKIVDDVINIKDKFDEIDEAVRPNVFIEFNHIVGISALRNGQDIQKLKDIIRETLDIHAESEITGAELSKQFRAQITERGPQIT